jgi:deazaflavin-dependent oxidoreductase (nitroreductase family)
MRMPIGVYRLGLGWLLGGRFVLIEHIGRRTGAHRSAVVEVVEHDRHARTWTVASGFGPTADWYRNVLSTPDLTIQVGRTRHAVTAEPLPPDDAAAVMGRYADAHPRTAQRLAGFMGYEVDGSREDYRALGRALPFIRFTPR